MSDASGAAGASVRVRFLGAGDAFNAAGRCHASYLVSAPSARFLLDCGATALLALRRDAIDVNSIDGVFVSHLHGDHFAGLPFLFLDFIYESKRTRPFVLLGPPGTDRRVRELFSATYRDLASCPLPFELRSVEVRPNERQNVLNADVLPFRVPHQQTEISLGLRVGVHGRVVLYSGDTGWTEDLVTQSQGADLFICECCFFETRVDFHLDYPRLAQNHRRFGCKRLILTHLGREVLARRDEVELELAHDGLEVEL
jgi:ribonuclease BN (tRNA processing enzyme)